MAPATTETYTLSLHDALPICRNGALGGGVRPRPLAHSNPGSQGPRPDRKSTRLNSSHMSISYAVFCLKKKIGSLIGIHPGETRSFPIQFPETFEQESLRGVRA